MKKRVISLIIVITLAISCLALFSAADIATETEELGVITAELQAVMRGATATEKIPVSIWTTEIDTDIVEEVVLTKAGINRDIIREMVEAGRIAEITQEQIDEYIAAERRIYAQMQAQNHKAFVEDYAFLKKASTAENAYLCSYAPMICVELTKSQIQTLSLDSEVDTMYYSPDTVDQCDMDVSLPLTKADAVRDSGDRFTGTGVKVGIIEYDGVPYTTNLNSANVEIPEEWEDEETPHATAVAEIIASTGSYRGIVPNVELYCTAYTNMAVDSEKTYTFTSISSKGDIRISLAWLRSVWFSSSDSTAHISSPDPETKADLPDFDIIIITPDNETLTYTGNVNNNLLIVQLDPDEYGDGTYTVKVRLKNSTGKKTYFGLAWWQEN